MPHLYSYQLLYRLRMRLIPGTILYFALTALLWYSKPRGDLWLIGSLALAGVYFPYFLWAITRPRRQRK